MLFMGIFFDTNCCGSTRLVILLLPLLLLLYVATACIAAFHTLSLAKSFLASVDKLSRTCNLALTKPGQESGSWAVFSYWSVLKHLDLTFLGWPRLGHLGKHRPPKSQSWRHLFSAPANSVCWSKLSPKVNCEVQILLLVNQVLIWVSDLLFCLSRVSESKISGFYLFWIRLHGKLIQWIYELSCNKINLWALL